MLAAYFISHFVTVLIMAVSLRLFIRVITVPLSTLVPVVLVFCVVGTYALNNIIENVYSFLIFGALGYLMVKTGFPLAPMVLGVILGDQIEVNLIRAIMTDSNLWLFITRPISGTLLVVAVVSFILAIYQERRNSKKKVRSD